MARRLAAVFRDLETAEDTVDVLMVMGADMKDVSLLTHSGEESIRQAGVFGLQERLRQGDVILTALVPEAIPTDKLLEILTRQGAEEVSLSEDKGAANPREAFAPARVEPAGSDPLHGPRNDQGRPTTIGEQ